MKKTLIGLALTSALTLSSTSAFANCDAGEIVIKFSHVTNTDKHPKGIAASLQDQGVDVINPPLMERAAFSALFAFGGDLHSMPPQGNMERAIENAGAFATQVFNRLTEDG